MTRPELLAADWLSLLPDMDRGSTHYEGCESEHPRCALRVIATAYLDAVFALREAESALAIRASLRDGEQARVQRALAMVRGHLSAVSRSREDDR